MSVLRCFIKTWVLNTVDLVVILCEYSPKIFSTNYQVYYELVHFGAVIGKDKKVWVFIY